MRKRHQALILILFLLLSVFSGGRSFAQELLSDAESLVLEMEAHGAADALWYVQRLVSRDKEWMIRFNEELDHKTVNEKNIHVINEGNEVQQIIVSSPSKGLAVKPQYEWKDGNYTLVIKDLRSESGKPLKYSYKMKFAVMENCPVGQLPWKSSAAVYPQFTISDLKNAEGRTLELGSLVADGSGKNIGRVVEIKKTKSDYEIRMDKKCVGDDPTPNNSGKRRMYSFLDLKPGQKFKIKGEGSPSEFVVSDEYGARRQPGTAYGREVQPGDAVYTHESIPPVREQRFVGFVDEVNPQPDGSVEVIVGEEEADPQPYEPSPDDINPPAAPIGTPEIIRTIDGHMHHTVFISGQKLYSMGQSPANRSLVPEQVNTGDYALIKQVAADSESALVLTVDGTVHRYVQGKGWIRIEEDNERFDGKRFIQVASGQDFYLVLTSEGEVWRHGNNQYFGANEEEEMQALEEAPLHRSDEPDGDSPLLKPEENPPEEESLGAQKPQAEASEQETSAASEGEEIPTLQKGQDAEQSAKEARGAGETELFAIGTGAAPTKNPVKLPGRAKQIDAVGKVALAVLENGELYMWGNNYNGQADPTQPGMGQAIKTPKQVMFSGGIIKMAQTDGERTVVLTSGGEVYFWGKNWSGLGNKGISKIDGLSDIVKIAVKKQHMLALRKDGAVFSIGANEFGELGVGNTRPYKNEEVFKLDFNGAIIEDIGVGDNTSYAIDTKNQLWVWGDNIQGQLGLGTRGEKARVVVPVIARTLEDHDFIVIN
ncbi:MAG: hypothetical protein Q4A78_09715 [Peptostreptococcaceae bacterium]|nr:hypothetical protein [Peptostreptococcaceae bacterium]